MNTTAFRGLLILILGGALAFRAAGLDLRPMHHDEANQALKFGLLLEKGEYRYDQTDHHGPSLYYLSLPLAKALGKNTLAALDETTLRLVPVLFGTGIILLFLLFLPDSGYAAVLFAGLYAALSPALVYYSRFYIQEMVFVFFVVGWLGALWRYHRRPAAGWAAAAGFFGGMMFATKETSVIILAASGAALILAKAVQKKEASADRPKTSRIRVRHLVLGFGLAGLTAALFFSSFFANPKGILDSMAAFSGYFGKAASPGFHIHPPLYYFGLLTYAKSGGLVWSEALILALAFLGIFAGLRKRSAMILFLAVNALLAAAVFSLIPYKTPWNLLPFYAGFILLAGYGTAYLFESLRRNRRMAPAVVLLIIGVVHLGWQSRQANFRRFADPRNPWVYAQTIPDFLKLVGRVNGIAEVAPAGKNILIKVVSDPDATWPLPWYLRSYNQVGYWTDWKAAGDFENVPLVIASQEQAAGFETLLKDHYQIEYYGLRPDVLLALFIRQDLWDEYLNRRK
jgi:uncharacterized protein (TIGR03663 family)